MEELSKTHPGLIRRKNTWYVRKRIPKDIEDMYSSDSVKKSLKTDSLSEAKKLYHVQMLEFESDFDQKRILKNSTNASDKLSDFNEASLLGLAFQWYRETYDKIDSSEKNNIHKAYQQENIDDAIVEAQIDRDAYQKALQTNDFEIVFPKAQKWLKANNITFKVDTKSYAMFCQYMLKSLVFMMDVGLKELAGKTVSNKIPSFFSPVSSNQQMFGIGSSIEPILLKDLLERFLKQSERDKYDEKTNNYYRTVVNLFESYANKELYLHDVTRMYVEDYRETLKRYPSRASTLKIFKNMTFHQILEKSEGMNIQRMNVSTINTHMSNLHSLFDYAELNDLVIKNPIKKMLMTDTVDDKDKRLPWPMSKLNEIFHMPVFQPDNPKRFSASVNDEPLYWCCLISLWAGMNLKEIVNLNVEDLKSEEGIQFIDVVKRPEQGSKLKSAYRVRRIPVHNELVLLGLPEFFNRRKKHQRLFFELTNKGKNGVADPVGKRFSTLIEKYGVKEKGSVETGKCSFHSFRHNYRDALRDTEMNKDIQHALGGWSTGDKKIVADNYGSGYTLKKLNDNLQKITYYGLDLTHLYVKEAKDGSKKVKNATNVCA